MKTYRYLISPTELHKNLRNPNYVIFDCRFDLLHPESGLLSYQKEHIHGARFADLNKDLASIPTAMSGNHPLPDWGKFNEFLSRNGVNSSKQIVVYDSVGGAYAVRLWWLLNVCGHNNVALLDGGFTVWSSMNLPMDANFENIAPSHFISENHLESVINITEMETIIKGEDILIIDARSPERFLGEVEPYYSIAGHIPGALNLCYQGNFDKSSQFLSKNELITKYKAFLSGRDPTKVVFYCGSGVTSLLNHFVMQMIGMKGSRVYIGSWSEWIKHHPNKIATGK